jgi:tRNA-specific 2-thiouridylase
MKIDPQRNEVVLGEEGDLYQQRMQVQKVHWLCTKQELEELKMKVEAQIRSTHRAAPAVVELFGEDEVLVKFTEPQKMITPGQAAVFYNGERVLGGGWING